MCVLKWVRFFVPAFGETKAKYRNYKLGKDFVRNRFSMFVERECFIEHLLETFPWIIQVFLSWEPHMTEASGGGPKNVHSVLAIGLREE